MKTGFLIFSLTFILIGCSSEPNTNSKPENFNNGINDIIATFSSSNTSDGEWDEGAEEETQEEAYLKVVENNELLYCYDTQNLLKIEIYGSVYKASIEYVEGGQKTVIVKGKDIEGSFVIFSEKLGQHGKLIIKSQDEVLKEISIEAEGCL
jgi:hypothetical protein